MRTHGWSGETPASDEEAVARIVAAGRSVVLARGRVPRIAEVARELGVSRATVYRYFEDGEALLDELTRLETGPFLRDIADALSSDTRPEQAVVHAVAYVIENLPKNPYLVAAFAGDARARRTASITSPMAQEFGREVLASLPIDWLGYGIDDQATALLVEQMLRMVQSFIVDPGDPVRHGASLTSYLSVWLIPTVGLLARGSGQNVGAATGVSDRV